MRKFLLASLAVVLSVLMLAGISAAPAQAQGPSNGKTTEIVGTVQRIGSGFIVVAGRRVDIRQAEIKVQLRIGVRVKVEARRVNGRWIASEIKAAPPRIRIGNQNTNQNRNDNDDNGNQNRNQNRNQNVNDNDDNDDNGNGNGNSNRNDNDDDDDNDNNNGNGNGNRNDNDDDNDD